MADIEIGMGKSARRGYGLDEVAIVPSRRTREPQRIGLGWEIDAFRFGAPVLAAPSDAVSSPATVPVLDAAGGGTVLHLEGLWTRHDDPSALLASLADVGPDDEVEVLGRLRDA